MDQERVTSLKSTLRGQVIEPGDPSYDQARKVYNGMIDKKPRIIARCANVADVIKSVRFGRDNNLLTAIRGGGHNGGGLGTCDEGLVIDLSPMTGIRVDPDARTVRADGGCTWGDVDSTTHQFGMATPGGVLSTTGVGGLTLGGGIGHLTRHFGLCIDNLLEADLVLADGRLVTASPLKNPDLFWAIRGGGGNFGVVTSFLFRLHPVSTVIGGPMLWPLEQAHEVMAAWRDFILEAPEALSGFFALLTVPSPPFPEALGGKVMCAVVWCHSGPADQFEADFRPVRRFPAPAFEHIGPMPHPALQTLFDPLLPPGLQWYWRGDFFNTLPDAAIDAFTEHGARPATPLSTMHLYPINGAAHRAAPSETAFSYRDANWSCVIAGIDPDPANGPRIADWAKTYWEATHPFSAGGAYVNFMMEEGQDRIRASYRANYDRLAAVKAVYDPTNFFRVNQNVQPAAAGAAGVISA